VCVELLWLTEPRRATCLAKVVQVRGDEFQLDRCLFAPTSRTHRHPQPADSGTIWIQGGKRRLERVRWHDGAVWHKLRGTVPTVGTTLQCQLDVERRQLAARAHAAMHLMIAAIQTQTTAAMTADPVVKGGGTFRLELNQVLAPATLTELLRQANDWGQRDRPIERLAVTRGNELHQLDTQRFHPPEPYPGPADVVQAAVLEGVCRYPCDGTLVDSARRIGRIVVSAANSRRNAMSLMCKVA
jgi:Ser-tRNA(Ala) deacylase AlaX